MYTTPMRLLLVEDDRRIVQTLKRGLTRESFAIDSCTDSDQALEYAMGEPYDLIILDRSLPGSYEGAQLCRKFRELNIHTPIIMLTAKDTSLDKVTGLNSGADDYLVKPFDFDELVARIHALLRRPTPVQSVTLTCRDLSLDTATKVVTRGNIEVSLRLKEFALLEYLLANKGRVLSKAAIINHVWGYDDIVIGNNVEVHIRQLRNKLDRAFPDRPPLIRTVHGLGYKLT